MLFIITFMVFVVAGDSKEGYYMGLSMPEADVPLYGPNNYPSLGAGYENVNLDLFCGCFWNFRVEEVK
jgi:hypothetical protein